MVARISLTSAIARSSGKGVAGDRCIAAGHEMFELAFDIGQHRACADPEKLGLEPWPSKLLLHQDEPGERILGSAQAARRLEANFLAGKFLIVADGPDHDKAHRKRGIDVFLAGRGLD